MQAGMDCATTLSQQKSEKNYDEMVKFLEPFEVEGKPVSGAMCQSAEDYSEMKTTIEQACVLLKNKCTYEMKALIKTITDLQKKIDLRKKP